MFYALFSYHNQSFLFISYISIILFLFYDFYAIFKGGASETSAEDFFKEQEELDYKIYLC